MRVWRIAKLTDSDKLSGLGGLYVSGRWHFRGLRVLYTSATASLAALEVLVHVDPALAPAGLGILEIEIRDDLSIEECDPTKLTTAWQNTPAPPELQEFGSKWLDEQRSAVLLVPSAIIPIERNYLINPLHPDAVSMQLVREIPFAFDKRFIR